MKDDEHKDEYMAEDEVEHDDEDKDVSVSVKIKIKKRGVMRMKRRKLGSAWGLACGVTMTTWMRMMWLSLRISM